MLRPTTHFYPRPPRGGRRCPPPPGKTPWGISIHALREEGDYHQQQRGRWCRISIHALREEGDLQGAVGKLQVLISIHALREEGDTL